MRKGRGLFAGTTYEAWTYRATGCDRGAWDRRYICPVRSWAGAGDTAGRRPGAGRVPLPGICRGGERYAVLSGDVHHLSLQERRSDQGPDQALLPNSQVAVEAGFAAGDQLLARRDGR